jgi:hypothetical protein
MWNNAQGLFRISLKRGQTHSSKFQGGGAKAPPGPPEINPAYYFVAYGLKKL